MIHDSKRSSLRIRLATRDDLPAIVRLMRERDDLPYRPTDVLGWLEDLDSDRILVWLATVDGDPVGMNSIFLRQVGSRDFRFRAGYWGNLYVAPQHRKAMVYPRLVFAMLRAAKENDIDFVYTATRRKQVAAGHQKLGFKKVGELSVLCKPLRPVRLALKHWHWKKFPKLIADPIDWIYGGALTARRFARSLRSVSAVDRIEEGFDAAILKTHGEENADAVRLVWDSDRWQDRFGVTIDGQPYVMRRAVNGNELRAAMLTTIAERGDAAVRALVVMDLIGNQKNPSAGRALLLEAERIGLRQGADVMLMLDGAGDSVRQVARSCGFFSSPESYDLLVWPAEVLDKIPGGSKPSGWRFSFADHDAF